MAIVLLTVVTGVAVRWVKVQTLRNDALYRHIAARELARNAVSRLWAVPIAELRSADWKSRVHMDELENHVREALPDGTIDVSFHHAEETIDALRFDVVVSWRAEAGSGNRQRFAVSGWRFATRPSSQMEDQR